MPVLPEQQQAKRASLIFLSLIEGLSMSQFRLARLVLMLAALGAAPGLVNTALAQKKEDKAAAPQGPSVRPEVYKLIDSAQLKQLIDAKNYTEVQNRVTQAEAIPNLTPYEQYAINRMKLSLAASSGADVIPALTPLVDSPYLTAQEKDNFVLALGNAHYNNKNWTKAIEIFKRYQKEGSDPSKVRASLIRAQYLAGDYAGAKSDLLPLLAESEKTGKAPTEEDLKLLASSANKVKDDATYLAAIEKLVTYYPSDDFWTDAVSRGVLRKPGYDGQSNDINLFRLMNSAVEKMSAEEYTSFAEILLTSGFFTEARKVLDHGFNKGVLSNGNAKQRQLREKAAKGAADDAKTIASGEASAAKSKNGAGLVNLGWAYVTMEQYDKGIGFIQQGIAKGGLKQPDEAKLRLGIAQLRAGHKDEAIQIFQDVKAGHGLSDIAKYWIVLANHPTAATTAAK
jgi:Tetratricopeptide repeat